MLFFSKAVFMASAIIAAAVLAHADEGDVSIDSSSDAGAVSVVVPAVNPVVATMSPDGSIVPVVTNPASGSVTQPEAVFSGSPSFQRAKARWATWVRSRGPACAPQFNAIAKFRPESDHVALVLHGLGSTPVGMHEIIDLLYDQGFTVLAPRLTGHYNQDIYELDNATAADWTRDAEESFELAKGFGSHVTVVGYSLGGILASRLMLEHPNQIENGVLFAPAWRISSLTSLASNLGTLLHTSLNDYMHVPATCTFNGSYVPGNAGREVENLAIDTEQSLGASYSLKRPTASIFARNRVPHIVFTSPTDEALDRAALSSICGWNYGFCKEISAEGPGHSGMTSNINRHTSDSDNTLPNRGPGRDSDHGSGRGPSRDSGNDSGRTVSGDITKFVNFNR